MLAERELSLLADDDFSPTLPAERHRLRRLDAAATRHRGEQPDCRRAHDREGPPRERRHPVATAGPHRGHQPRLSRRARGTPSLVHDQAFNVGRPQDVVQIRDVAEMVREAVPGSTLSFADGAGPDLRNYKVDFSKLEDTFPDLKLSWTVHDGITELVAGVHRARPDPRRLHLLAVRATAPDTGAALRRRGGRDAAPHDRPAVPPVDSPAAPRAVAPNACDLSALSSSPRRAAHRLGVADQVMSSLTNRGELLRRPRALRVVAVRGVLQLTFVTYSFALNASRGLATDPLMVRLQHRRAPEVAAGRGTPPGRRPCRRVDRRHWWSRSSRCWGDPAGVPRPSA